jgi:hypothetical protein
LQQKKIQGLKPKGREFTGTKMMIRPKINYKFVKNVYQTGHLLP